LFDDCLPSYQKIWSAIRTYISGTYFNIAETPNYEERTIAYNTAVHAHTIVGNFDQTLSYITKAEQLALDLRVMMIGG
jgi:hypothetical protein